MDGVKGQDVVILLKLASMEDAGVSLQDGDGPRGRDDGDPYSVRNLEAQLGISKSEVNASIQRCLASGLAIRSRYDGHPSPQRRNLLEFIFHGLRFVFPVKGGGIVRGMPTGFAAPVLERQLISAGEHIYVWPDPEGRVAGQDVKPLFRSVPMAARMDSRLYEYLALTDAIRLGAQRETRVARGELEERLLRQ